MNKGQRVRINSPLSVFHNHTGRILDKQEKLVYPVHVVFDTRLNIYGVPCKESMFKVEEVEVLDA